MKDSVKPKTESPIFLNPNLLAFFDNRCIDPPLGIPYVFEISQGTPREFFLASVYSQGPLSFTQLYMREAVFIPQLNLKKN